jgi:hypothetical protein
MALNSDNIYIGQAKMTFAILDRDFNMFDRKPSIILNDISTFKASNESTFFGAYSSNVAVKAAAYNQLRVNSFTILNDLRTNGTMNQNIKGYFNQNPTVVASLQSRVDRIIELRTTKGYVNVSNYFQNIYHFTAYAKIYLPAIFDTVALKAEFTYRSNKTNSAIYPNTMTFDFVT